MANKYWVPLDHYDSVENLLELVWIKLSPNSSYMISSNSIFQPTKTLAKRLYLSDDGGNTWNQIYPAGDIDVFWKDAALSSDGRYIIVISSTSAYVSNDFGSTWTDTSLSGDFTRVACSYDGIYMYAVKSEKLNKSSNYGVDWVEDETYLSVFSVCCSSNGSVVAITRKTATDQVCFSFDYGENWTFSNEIANRTPFDPSISCDSSGNKFLFSPNPTSGSSSTNGYLWLDRGDTEWNIIPYISKKVFADQTGNCVAVSPDGLTMLIGVGSRGVYRSTDSGVSWANLASLTNTNQNIISVVINSLNIEYYTSIFRYAYYIQSIYIYNSTKDNSSGVLGEIGHWASSSGGTDFAVPPTENDIIYFDSLSFVKDSQILEGGISCNGFICDNPTNFPIFDNNEAISIYNGDMILSDNVVYRCPILFGSGNCTIQGGGENTDSSQLTITVSDGSLTLNCNIICKKFSLSNGNFDTNGYNIKGTVLDINEYIDFIFLRNSTLEFDNIYIYDTDKISFDVGTSKIICHSLFDVEIFSPLTKEPFVELYDVEFSRLGLPDQNFSLRSNLKCHNLTISDITYGSTGLNLYDMSLIWISGDLVLRNSTIYGKTSTGILKFIKSSGNNVYATNVKLIDVETSSKENICFPMLGTASAESTTSGSVNYIFDYNSFSSAWRTNILPCVVKYDLGEGNSEIVKLYTIRCEGSGYYVNSWTFEGSNNDEDWVILDTQVNQIILDNWINKGTYEISNYTPYRYYRFNLTEGGPNGYVSLRNVSLYKNSGGVKFYSLLTDDNIDGGGNIGWLFEESNVNLLYKGSANIGNIYLGTSPVSKIYSGSDLLWEL